MLRCKVKVEFASVTSGCCSLSGQHVEPTARTAPPSPHLSITYSVRVRLSFVNIFLMPHGDHQGLGSDTRPQGRL